MIDWLVVLILLLSLWFAFDAYRVNKELKRRIIKAEIENVILRDRLAKLER